MSPREPSTGRTMGRPRRGESHTPSPTGARALGQTEVRVLGVIVIAREPVYVLDIDGGNVPVLAACQALAALGYVRRDRGFAIATESGIAELRRIDGARGTRLVLDWPDGDPHRRRADCAHLNACEDEWTLQRDRLARGMMAMCPKGCRHFAEREPDAVSVSIPCTLADRI